MESLRDDTVNGETNNSTDNSVGDVPDIPTSTDVEDETYGDHLSEEAAHERITVERHPSSIRDVINWYSYAEVGLSVSEENVYSADVSLDGEEMRAVVLAESYPAGGDVYGPGVSEPFTVNSTEETDITVEMDFSHGVIDERITYYVSLVDPNAATHNWGYASEAMDNLVQTSDPVEITEDGMRRHSPDYIPSDDTEDGIYTRKTVEGGYAIEFEPSVSEWDLSTTVPVYIPKQIYARHQDNQEERTLLPTEDRVKIVTEALELGFPEAMLNAFLQSADLDGNHDDTEMLLMMVRFVQSLPYVLDEQSVGFDDYTRFPSETLVDVEGDCIDTSVLLASLLKAWGHDTALIFYLPSNPNEAGHAAVGLAFADEDQPIIAEPFEESGSHYHYIETTDRWDIGDVPSSIDRRNISVVPL